MSCRTFMPVLFIFVLTFAVPLSPLRSDVIARVAPQPRSELSPDIESRGAHDDRSTQIHTIAESEPHVRGRILNIGHRGASGHLPENTLAAFEKAVDLGADMVELDVHLSADGRVVVIHDETVDRTTNGSGRVSDMTLEQLRALDAGGGEKIPTLEDVLQSVAGRCGVNVELKGLGVAAPVADILRRFVRESGISRDNFVVSSFDHAQLAELRDIEPRIRRAPLFGAELPEDFIETARGLGAWSVNLNKGSVTPELVGRCRRQGLRVLVYTVNDPVEIESIKSMEVDGIICDYPERL